MIRTERHPHFRREGNNLHYGMAIKLVDALVGYDLEVRASGLHVAIVMSSVIV